MKNKLTNWACNLGLMFLIACFALTSCDKDKELDKQDPIPPSPVSFTSVVKAPGAQTTLSEGAMVGVSINGKSNLFIAGKEGALNPESPLFWEDDDVKMVKAWHSSKTTKADYACPDSWEVSEDQTKGDSNDELLFAQKEIDPKGEDRQLDFYVQTSSVELQISANLKIAEVTIGEKSSFKLAAKWQEGEWAAEEGKTGSIKPYLVAEEGGMTTYRATVIPQNVSGKEFIFVTFEDGRKEMYTPQGDDGNLKPGHKHTFKFKTSTPAAAPVLSADKYQIKNNGETATFKVMLDNKEVTDKATFTKDGQPFSGHTFSSTQAGKYEFIATVEGKASNSILITVVDEPIIPELKADVTTIIADGKSAVTFTVTPSDAVVSCEELKEFSGKVFTTTVPRTYHFKATYQGKSSEVITIIAAEESVPVLSADKYEIKNNGEKATFKVMYQEKDVTSEAVFTKDGQAFDGHSFSSTATGSYEFAATIDGKVSNTITITVVEEEKPEPIIPQLTASTTTIVADGVSSVTFTATPADAIISCDEVPGFSGTVFTTTKAGTYHFKATYDGNVSEIITITATEPQQPDIDVEVSVTSPSDNGAWEDQGTDNGTIIF